MSIALFYYGDPVYQVSENPMLNHRLCLERLLQVALTYQAIPLCIQMQASCYDCDPEIMI